VRWLALWSTVLFYGLMLAAFMARGRRANIALLAIIAAMYPTISFAFLIGLGKGG
jgi:hypothetical protein